MRNKKEIKLGKIIRAEFKINEIDLLTQQVKNINANKKVIKKEVEIVTKITYTYEDGSTKEINEVKKHNFNY